VKTMEAPELARPRLRGVSHQYAFFASLALGVALVATAPPGWATAACAVYASAVCSAPARSTTGSPGLLGGVAACAGSTTR